MTTFISAPFGNYLKFKNAVSVTGTWTYKPRPGLLKQIIKTLRYTRNGWRNKIGLRNRGIEYGIQHTNFNEVLSIAAINQYDWINLESIVPESQSVELNISCPNLDVHQDTTDFKGFDLWPTKKRKWCIVKVPPTASNNLLDKIVDMGYNQIHASNTLYTPNGGLSGQVLVEHTLRIIDYIKNKHKHIEIIAGGGVKSKTDAQNYIEAGADHISLGTVCFTPWKVSRILK